MSHKDRLIRNTVAFATLSHPLAIVAEELNREDNEELYLLVDDIIADDPRFSSYCDGEHYNDLVYHCSDENARQGLVGILNEIRIQWYFPF